MENNKKLFTVTSSPNIKTDENTRGIMLTVLFALAAPGVMSVVFFGIRPLIIILFSVASCVLSEFLFCLITKRPIPIGDFSAVVTGVLLAYCLPPSVPYWIPVIGGAFAIVIVKQLFGGIGQNFMNPALAGRAFLMSWASVMTAFPAVFSNLPLSMNVGNLDLIASATPLNSIYSGYTEGSLENFSTIIGDLFIGKTAGCIGEVSTFFLLIGFVILLVRKIITWHVPVFYLGTVALLTFLFPQNGIDNLQFMFLNLCSGGLMLGAIFMATDYSTSPVTRKGKIFYGIGCGLLTVFIRYFGGYPEGVCYSILIMNSLVWLIDKYTRPRRYGTGGGGVHV